MCTTRHWHTCTRLRKFSRDRSSPRSVPAAQLHNGHSRRLHACNCAQQVNGATPLRNDHGDRALGAGRACTMRRVHKVPSRPGPRHGRGRGRLVCTPRRVANGTRDVVHNAKAARRHILDARTKTGAIRLRRWCAVHKPSFAHMMLCTTRHLHTGRDSMIGSSRLLLTAGTVRQGGDYTNAVVHNAKRACRIGIRAGEGSSSGSLSLSRLTQMAHMQLCTTRRLHKSATSLRPEPGVGSADGLQAHEQRHDVVHNAATAHGHGRTKARLDNGTHVWQNNATSPQHDACNCSIVHT